VLVVVVTASVDDVVAGFGANEPVAPVGKPETLRLTWEVKLADGVIVTP
jgi:hypothetical protein